MMGKRKNKIWRQIKCKDLTIKKLGHNVDEYPFAEFSLSVLKQIFAGVKKNDEDKSEIIQGKNPDAVIYKKKVRDFIWLIGKKLEGADFEKYKANSDFTMRLTRQLVEFLQDYVKHDPKPYHSALHGNFFAKDKEHMHITANLDNLRDLNQHIAKRIDEIIKELVDTFDPIFQKSNTSIYFSEFKVPDGVYGDYIRKLMRMVFAGETINGTRVKNIVGIHPKAHLDKEKLALFYHNLEICLSSCHIHTIKKINSHENEFLAELALEIQNQNWFRHDPGDNKLQSTGALSNINLDNVEFNFDINNLRNINSSCWNGIKESIARLITVYRNISTSKWDCAQTADQNKEIAEENNDKERLIQEKERLRANLTQSETLDTQVRESSTRVNGSNYSPSYFQPGPPAESNLQAYPPSAPAWALGQ